MYQRQYIKARTLCKYELLKYTISGFGRGVNDICTLLEFYAALHGSLLPTFRGNLSLPLQGSSSLLGLLEL
jgi:hypothetical protein